MRGNGDILTQLAFGADVRKRALLEAESVRLLARALH
jgi:hypothetical protein